MSSDAGSSNNTEPYAVQFVLAANGPEHYSVVHALDRGDAKKRVLEDMRKKGYVESDVSFVRASKVQ